VITVPQYLPIGWTQGLMANPRFLFCERTPSGVEPLAARMRQRAIGSADSREKSIGDRVVEALDQINGGPRVGR